MAITSYITPITDRTRNDVEYARLHQNDLVNKNKGAWNYTDANRVCNNLKYAAEWMYDQGFLSTPYEISVKTNWVESDIITIEQLNTMIIYPMNNLYTYSRNDLNWIPIASVVNMDYHIANAIEKNIHALATQLLPPPDTYHLTVNSGAGSGDYAPRTVVNITANTPEEGLVFDYWSGDHLENIGNARSAITTYTMPYQDVTLTAHYTSSVPHILTVVTYTSTDTVALYMGQTRAIEADPAPQGKVFHHWDVSPSRYDNNLYEPAATTTFTMPNEAVTLTAIYIDKGQKQLVINQGTGSGWYDYDTYVPISSNKAVGDVFTNWTGATQYLTGPATQEYNSVRIPDVARIELTAHWTTPPATNIQLTVVNGVITSTGQTTGTFTEGDRISITANAAPSGQTFTSWSKTGGGSISNSGSSTATFVIGSSAATVTANYRTLEYHTLTLTTSSGTTVTIRESQERVTIDANPIPSGYTFDQWTGDTSGFVTGWISTTATMGTSDRTITANYRQLNTHTLTVHQLSGDVTYTKTEGETVSITAEAAPTGKQFTDWVKSGSGSISFNASQTITYTFGNGDGELTPRYVNIWTITVVGGTIDSPAGSTKVLREGSNYRLDCRSLAVYEQFTGWTVSGPGTVTNSAATNTRFTVGAGDATITAGITQYPDKTLTIYWRNPSTQVDTLVSSQTYTYGSTITGIEAEVAPDQTTFSTWLGDVELLQPSALASTVTINSLTKNATLIATYYYPQTPEYYTLTVYDGSGSGTYATGSQQTIRANTPSQGWEFYNWYGDTQYLVNPDLTQSENAVIIPQQSITLHAKFNMIGELPLYRVSVTGRYCKWNLYNRRRN